MRVVNVVPEGKLIFRLRSTRLPDFSIDSAFRVYFATAEMELRPRQLMPGPERNDTQAPLLLGVCGSLTLFAVLLLSARLWSRVRPFWNLHLDDWTAVVATVSRFPPQISAKLKSDVHRSLQ
jgi:hypothetical protein